MPRNAENERLRLEFKALRRITGFTQQGASDFLGVSFGSIKSWEGGDRPVSESALMQLRIKAVIDKKVALAWQDAITSLD